MSATSEPVISPASHTLQNEYGAPISQADAQACARAALLRAQEIGVPMTVVISDQAGIPVYLARMDRAIAAGAQVAPEKAKCAALYKRSTKAFEDAVINAPGGTRFLALSGVVPIEGGLPLVAEGKIVGAIGVSGGTGAQDGLVAKAGVDALADAKKPAGH